MMSGVPPSTQNCILDEIFGHRPPAVVSDTARNGNTRLEHKWNYVTVKHAKLFILNIISINVSKGRGWDGSLFTACREFVSFNRNLEKRKMLSIWKIELSSIRGFKRKIPLLFSPVDVAIFGWVFIALKGLTKHGTTWVGNYFVHNSMMNTFPCRLMKFWVEFYCEANGCQLNCDFHWWWILEVFQRYFLVRSWRKKYIFGGKPIIESDEEWERKFSLRKSENFPY